jgi:hypothetical protein
MQRGLFFDVIAWLDGKFLEQPIHIWERMLYVFERK